MKLSYNVTGSERKPLIAAISKVLECPAKYLGAPTFAYDIGDYHIDKVGTLAGPDNLDLEDALHQVGFDADGDSREYDEPDTYESRLGSMGALEDVPDIDQHHPGRYTNFNAPITELMQRQVDEVLVFQDIRMDGCEELGMGRTLCESFQGENGMQANDVPMFDEYLALEIEMPRSSFTDRAMDNLKRLVESKGTFIKKALGVETLEIEVTEDKVRFPWFERITTPQEIKAYTHFVAALCKMAREQKRVIAKEKETDNEKYTFRCFLLRLGLIGEEYKEARKILLRNLTGSAAFRTGTKDGGLSR
ncbi:virulence protein [Alkalibacter rhizosphaerae]|uniref:Virulence protein n=1 Tax=Alkalibacter rhizosphaerae TaxID=2815577 RepID=A0A974XGW0_9FIRM|nr:virulence protein [Alkalibacter rhizosphaerae]QSX09551.1 virulence protein [Alkalibacter rhizosphaerae]